MPPKTELQHHLEVAKWLKRKKGVIPIFRTDYAAGLKLTAGQAKNHYRLQSGKAYPDLFIPLPMGKVHGLYLELKKPDVVLVLKDGTLTKDKHIREQMQVLLQLHKLGYGACMVKGHTEAKQAINDYLAGQKMFPTKYLLPKFDGDIDVPSKDDDLPF